MGALHRNAVTSAVIRGSTSLPDFSKLIANGNIKAFNETLPSGCIHLIRTIKRGKHIV